MVMMVLMLVMMVSSGLMFGAIASSMHHTNELNRSLSLLETMV